MPTSATSVAIPEQGPGGSNLDEHQANGASSKTVYKIVLTGGPCGGKTTGQARLSAFFEKLGWKVFRVPETATLLMGGGVKWTDLNQEQADKFQLNLIKTMMQIEQTYFDLAELCDSNCVVICDRGVMDPSAYMPSDVWNTMIGQHHWNNVDLRDSRYNQVIHMVTAAKGAEDFYTTEEHVVRHEGPELARELDDKVAQAWVGHPYYDVIDNSTDFEGKVMRMMASVCHRIGINFANSLNINSKKFKFLITAKRSEESWPSYQEMEVISDYLVTPSDKMQARVRKRGKNGVYTFTHTVRRPKIKGQRVELRRQISGRTYQMLLAQRDNKHYTVFKKRRCFLWNERYFQLDIYLQPCHPRCCGLMILETYGTGETGPTDLPPFLTVESEITDQPLYSMYNLSMKDFHNLEIKAGVKRSETDSFDYRNTYAKQASNEGVRINDFACLL